MKGFLITVVLTLAAVLGLGWYTDQTVKQGIGSLAGMVGMSGLVGEAGPAGGVDEAAMIAAAEALDQKFLEAFNSGNGEALAALYWNSPDVVSYPPDTMAVRGRAEIGVATAATAAAMPGAKIELTESHQFVVGDAVVGHGTFRMSMTGPDGEPMEILGRFTDVKAERDGAWVYLVDHASVPMPAPDAPM